MKKTMKKLLAAGLVLTMVLGALTGCGSKETEQETEREKSRSIAVISREDGSGTRGAFVELFGIEEKDAEGNKVDMTTEEAEITNNTSVMMTTVAGNEDAIGYISLGSLNDTVKAVCIDGAEASVENIKAGTYKVARPFNIATQENISDAAKDFINYIMSDQGQAVVTEKGYICNDSQPAYECNGASGKVTVSGSSSVTPVMEVLAERYQEVNTAVTVEIQQTDSSSGITAAIDGVCDIGMASRELKDSELEAGLVSVTIATDGIAVIVNEANTVDDLTSEQVKAIFTGEITSWGEIQ